MLTTFLYDFPDARFGVYFVEEWMLFLCFSNVSANSAAQFAFHFQKIRSFSETPFVQLKRSAKTTPGNVYLLLLSTSFLF